MPFKSQAQRAWMYANHPGMAKRWADHTSKGKQLPKRVSEDALSSGEIRVDDPHPGSSVLTFTLFDRAGRQVGEMSLGKASDPKRYRVMEVHLSPEVRGKGIGVSLYRHVAGWLHREMGATLSSDSTRSPDAERVWRSLSNSGLAGQEGDGYTMKAVQEIMLASIRGPAALAEAIVVREGRLGAVAMLIVPSEPPGRLTADVIRRLAAGRTRIIVAATSGRLAPGNFEKLLRLSLPDVESKVDVVDSHASLSDAIEAAEAAGFYEPGQALQVFCEPARVADFESEIVSGSLTVDPTVITVSRSSAPDDSDDVISAIHSGDEAEIRGVLDPHVFSDGGLQRYRSVLFKEGLLREFLSDISPSRELAISRLHDILTAEVGEDEAGTLQYLGSGRNGSAYRHPDGFIVKVTTDPREARSADCLVGVNTGHLGRIYQVRPVADGVWMIIQEDLERLPGELGEQFDAAMSVVEGLGALDHLNSGHLLKVVEAVQDSPKYPTVVDVLRRFGVVGMCRELRQLGLTADFHSGNVMLRGSLPVLIDLGTPGDDPGTLREFGSGAPGSGAAGPATMKGSNSSSWSNGRGALQAPANHVPEDENETEGDRALDWGPGRITGASF